MLPGSFYDIIFIKFLVSSIEIGRTFEEIMLFLVISALVFLIPAAFDGWYTHIYKEKTNADIFAKVNTMLFDKATEVDWHAMRIQNSTINLPLQ